MNKIIQGDCLEELKNLENNSIDFVCTDPPYGYSFMGKNWDKAVPSVETWQECLRVLKPGAFCCVMSAPRSDVQMHMIQNLTEAGFRLDFTPIYWTYASGFPKAGNIGKMVDKKLGVEREQIDTGETLPDVRANNYSNSAEKERIVKYTSVASTDQAKALDGSYAGFQPKPAVEVIIVAMKPLSEKTFVDQALKNNKGVSWLDDARIPTNPKVDDKRLGGKGSWDTRKAAENIYEGGYSGERIESSPNGRFPANLLVSDDVLNDGTISGEPKRTEKVNKGFWGTEGSFTGVTGHGDSGSYSRYFDLDKWASTLPFLIVPKASKSEKNKGLDSLETRLKLNPMRSANGTGDKNFEGGFPDTFVKNYHPTVKPLKLMSYLITLFSREDDVVLDPFVGSGTTCLAAKKLNRKYIGIEQEEEYVKIAEARLNADKQERLL